MRNKKEKFNKEKKISDILVFWISIFGFILAVISFFQNSSHKILIVTVAISLCAICTIVSLFRAIRSDEQAKHNDKRIEQLKKEVSDGKIPSDSYLYDKNIEHKGYIVDILTINAHILYEANSCDWGIDYKWIAKCHLSNPKIILESLSTRISGDYPITNNDSLNIKAIIKNGDIIRPMEVHIENIDLKTKLLTLIIPKDFFDSYNSFFSYTLSYTWPRSYRLPKEKFSFFNKKENNSTTCETHIRIWGNKQCFSRAYYEIVEVDDDFKTNKTNLSTSFLKNNEISVTLDIGKGTKDRMLYITTSI